MPGYQTKSPLLFLIFNRPDVTKKVFEQIKLVRPSRLYIAADGPRADNENDINFCQQTKELIKVDWDCDLKTLYRTENLGCKLAVSSAIDWFFEQEEEGIILEDDCLPSIDFFRFCDEMLERYRFDTRIRHIAGSNFNKGKKYGTGSYYFSNQTIIWGWASWKRVWKDYDVNLTRYNTEYAIQQFENIFADKQINEIWARIFTEMKTDKIDTWDHQLAFINYFNNSLSVTPNYNLVSNIGFGEGATHTVDDKHPLADIPLDEMAKTEHPLYILPQKQADLDFLRGYFRIDEQNAQLKKHNSLRRKVKRGIKSLFNK